MRRRILLALLGLVLALAATWTGFTLYWRGRYEAEIERIRAAGHPVLPEDVVVPECPDDENMLPLLEQARAQFDALVEGNPRVDLYGVSAFDERLDGTPVPGPKVRALYALFDSYFELVQRAAARPRLVISREVRNDWFRTLPEQLRVRSLVLPEHAMGDARALLQMALAWVPEDYFQASDREDLVRLGLECLKLGLARGDAIDSEFGEILARIDPIASARTEVVLFRAMSVGWFEGLRGGAHLDARLRSLIAFYDAIGYELAEMPPFDGIDRWYARPWFYGWAAGVLETRSDEIESLDPDGAIQHLWGSELTESCYRRAVRRLKELRCARLAVHISLRGEPPPDPPLHPDHGNPLECVATEDGYRIEGGWIVKVGP